MEEYRIDVKVRNNIILDKIEKCGYKTLGEFCRINNIMRYTSSLGSIINMKESPMQTNGKFKQCIIYAANLLGCAPEDFFTDIQINTILKSNKRSIKVNEAEMNFILENKKENKLLENIIEDEQRDVAIENALNTLNPREKKILEMRMGMGEYGHEHTLKEVGELSGLSAPRVRQIEAKALRKLRHPTRVGKLREFT